MKKKMLKAWSNSVKIRKLCDFFLNMNDEFGN